MILLSTRGQQLTVGSKIIVADTVNYIDVVINASGDWLRAQHIFAHFVQGEDEAVVEANNGRCSVRLSAGEWSIWLHGETIVDGQITFRVTSTVERIKVQQSGMQGDDPFPPVFPTFGELIVEKVDKAIAAAEAAENSAGVAEQAAINSAANAEQAAEWADAAAGAAMDATRKAAAALQAAQAAEQSASNAEDAADAAQGAAAQAARQASDAAYVAGRAADSAEAARQAAAAAQGNAQAAQASAGTAATRAAEAATSAATSATAAGKAADDARAAQTAATQSATSAQGAATSAQSAQQSAQTAQGEVSKAQAAAAAAKSDADVAAAQAQTAGSKATEAAASAAEAADVVSQLRDNFADITVLTEAGHLTHAYIAADGTQVLYASDDCRIAYYACNPDTQYTVKKIAGKAFRVAYATVIPVVNNAIRGTITNTTGTEINITTDSEAKFLVVYYTFNDRNPDEIHASIRAIYSTALDSVARKNIEEIRNDLATVQTRLDHVDEVILETVQPLQKQADDTERSLEALWKLNKGQTYDIEQRNESGMNAAPSGAKFMSLEEVEGKTEQESTNGYQLARLTGERENYGIKVSEPQHGGLFHVSGIVTSSVSLWLAAVSTPVLTAGSTITVKVDSPYTLAIWANGINKTLTNLTAGKNNQATVTIPEGATSITMCINHYFAKDTEVDVEIYGMIEYGSVAHDFEPYTGGIPAPNPDYPQEIVSVDSFEVKVYGKNLYDRNTYSLVLNKAVEVSTGEVYNATSGNWYGTPDFIPCEIMAGKTICHSTELQQTICFYDADKNYLRPYFSKSETTMVVPDKACYMRFDIHKDTYQRAQIELGTAPTAYEPYTETIRTITPLRPLNAIGEYVDVCNVEDGVWNYKVGTQRWDGNTSFSAWSAVAGCLQKTIVDGLFPTPAYTDVVNTIRSDIFKSIQRKQAADKSAIGLCVVNGATKQIAFWAGPNMETVAAFRAYLAEHPCVVQYPLESPATEPIDPDDLAFLRSLELLPADKHIIVTDNHGRDVSYLLEYITKLDEVN